MEDKKKKLECSDEENPICLTEYGELSASDLHNMKSQLVSGCKKKVAVLLAYCGKNYHGLQMNRSDRSLDTIEKHFFMALTKSKLVLPNCSIDPSKMGYKCASRTDKGVSTCGVVLSMKLILNEKAAELINEHLPKDIRVLGVKKTTKHFNAQFQATARTYTYTCPTFVFANASDVSSSYRITPDKLSTINDLLRRYIGTYSYHNFTSGKIMNEMSAKRFIKEFTFEQPFEHDSIEFITFRLKGQSFMIHQIRKMMGLLIAIVGGYAETEHFKRAFNLPRADVPIAPSHGLVLEKVHYDKYNRDFSERLGSLDFEECDELRKNFLRQQILPSVYFKDVELNKTMDWLKTLAFHDFSEDGGYRDRSHLPKRVSKIDEPTSACKIVKLVTEQE